MEPVRIPLRFETEDGRPRSDAMVVVVRASQPVPERALFPDADGRLDLWLPAGKAEIEVRFPGGDVQRLALEPDAGTTAAEVVVR